MRTANYDYGDNDDYDYDYDYCDYDDDYYYYDDDYCYTDCYSQRLATTHYHYANMGDSASRARGGTHILRASLAARCAPHLLFRGCRHPHNLRRSWYACDVIARVCYAPAVFAPSHRVRT